MTRKFAHTTLIILLIVLLGHVVVFFDSQKLVNQAENQVVQLAKDTVGLKRTTKFYVFNKDDTSYTIEGVDRDGQQIYFAYQPDTDAHFVGKVDELVTEYEAQSLTLNDLPGVTVKEARLGIEKDQFIWEVSFIDSEGDLGYHYINAASGHWYETINNL